MTTTAPILPFDLRIAKAALVAKDERLARLIEETVEFQIEMESTDSPYEALMESIAYQSISGKAAATRGEGADVRAASFVHAHSRAAPRAILRRSGQRYPLDPTAFCHPSRCAGGCAGTDCSATCQFRPWRVHPHD